ncbi:uncharacterized protein EI97DRAFT_458298 [Westerdykella ornata]|uniref:LIM zinc-binding domain-containing protein n=1 Tax=Westerdykella ornata TaxID=318751 RepID=A0A6A6JN56_WESOR|nr:uncharacterized protein EI97DRAFT_458298 [Westerdykella ornata]KAF2276359.1 hypothetical protein EI97DRAFT_458298 [Westerdykella ornata]
MANTDRMSFLPTIKCSTCSVDIDISQLADHVCAPSPAKSNAPPRLDRAATFGPSTENKPMGQQRTGRMPPPPRINPSAANRPFLSPSSASSYNDPSAPSPLSPARGRPPFKMNRSATSPMPRAYNPPSPDLPLNMDCAFPPFPTSGAVKRGKSRHRDKLDPHPRYAEASPLYAPLSPRMNAGENIAKRMDTIAPGPFDGREGDRRPSTSDGRNTPGPKEAQPGHKRSATQASTKSNPAAADPRSSLYSNRSRSSTFSGRGGSQKQDLDPIPPMPPLVSQHDESQSEGIEAFLTRLQKETIEFPNKGFKRRSRSFPGRQENGEVGDDVAPRRRPLQSGLLSPSAENSSTLNPRSVSPSASYNESPSLPPIKTHGKHVTSNTLHTPSDSGLSHGSFSSDGMVSAASSRSSPATSVDSGPHSRNVSKTENGVFPNDESIPRVASPESFMDPRTPPKPIPERYPGAPTYPGAPRYPGAPTYNMAPNPAPLPRPGTFSIEVPESPLDPAIQHGHLYRDPPSPLEKFLGSTPTTNAPNAPKSHQKAPEPEPVTRTEKRPTGTGRGKCRGCAEPIIGKSVKDSSGRLTGRYHKQCFVCKTCRSPFPSAEFYVFDNSPYCEQHYHELNGSLCRTCNRGIEGQYLETDQRHKFHPRCFTCLTCRVILRDDYYEVNGKAYCERHAYAVQKSMSSLAPGPNNRFLNNNLQKRRTRLMMMM